MSNLLPNEPMYDLILKMIEGSPGTAYSILASVLDIDVTRVRKVAYASGIHERRVMDYQQKWEALVANMKDKGISAMGKLAPDVVLLEGSDLEPVDLLDEVSQPQESLMSMGAGD